MKKLFRQEWKIYVMVFLVTIIWLFHSRVYYGIDEEVVTLRIAGAWFETQAYNINQIMFYTIPKCVILFLLVRKGIIFLMEKDTYGREFLQTLPIMRIQRICFHLYMDILYILLSVVSGVVINYSVIIKKAIQNKIEVPWLRKAVFGEMIVVCCFLLMILAVINFLEVQFADGFIRIIGVTGMVGISSLIAGAVFQRYYTNPVIQKMYGFFTMELIGNRYPLGEKGSLGDIGWVSDCLQPEMYFNGEAVKYAGYNLGHRYAIATGELSRLYQYSKVGTFIGFAFAYLALAVLLIAFAVYFYKRQELSKQGFYFTFGRYLFSIWVSVVFIVFIMGFTVSIWHKCFVIAAGMLIFFFLVYAMNPDRKKLSTYK